MFDRRDFLRVAAAAGLAGLASPRRQFARADDGNSPRPKFGLVTYLWGRDWDLPTLIGNCEQTELFGVELRTTHAHGVEPSLSARERADVKRRFDDSPVTCVGLGSNERFDEPDPEAVRKAVAATREFVVLSHDIGSSGVKVKPNQFHDGVPHEQTIAQIGAALRELGEFADGYDQQIRLEVHGGCAELPTIRAIVDAADHPRVAVCWNSNPTDLAGEGLEHNFRLVRDSFGRTLHVHALDDPDYPYQELFDLLADTEYDGWILLEASGEPDDRLAALIGQRILFDELLTRALRA